MGRLYDYGISPSFGGYGRRRQLSLKRHGTVQAAQRICRKEAFKPSEGGEDLLPKMFALNQFRRPDGAAWT
jgi:hypothetical protein